MLISSAAILIGLAFLAWGADRFVMGASATARNLGVPSIVIGLTIAGFATSAPEILVSAIASLEGNSGLAVGNAVGSNIANLGLVLGATALLRPLVVRSQTMRRELPALLVATLLTFVLLLDGHLGRVDGSVLLGCLVPLSLVLIRLSLRSSVFDPIRADYAAEIPTGIGMGRAIMLLAVGLVALLVGAELLVYGAIAVAQVLGISDLVIGLTMVAVGTSLPELAVSIAGALKGEHDLVLGNVIGSNIFNLLAVIGIAGVVGPHAFEGSVLSYHFPVMGTLTIAVFALAYNRRRENRLGRPVGGLLLSAFVIYHGFVAWEALGR